MFDLPTFFRKETVLEFRLEKPSLVTIKLSDENENLMDLIIENKEFKEGKHKIKITKTHLKKKKFWAEIYIKNSNGNFCENFEILIK